MTPDPWPVTAGGRPVELVLHWDVMFCPRHLAPLRMATPLVPVAMFGLAVAAMGDPAIVAECGSDPKELGSVLGRHRPICCYLGDDIAARVVGLALAGHIYQAGIES